MSLQVQARHVVFDLDWTLFYVSNYQSFQSDQSDIFIYKGTYYRLAPGAVDILHSLSQVGFEISFFSGGDEPRNQFLLEQIQKLSFMKNKKIKFHKTLHFQHLTMKSNLPGLRFADRWAKDLKKIHSDLSQIILVDDIAKFSLPDQQSNLMHLNKTYNDFPIYTSRSSMNDTEFDPPNFIEWYKERHKLYAVLDRVLSLDPNKTVQEQLPNIMKKEICRFLFITQP